MDEINPERDTLRSAIGKAIEAMKETPEGLMEELPSVMYIADVSEDYEVEDEDDRVYGAAETRDDLVGSGRNAVVGVYKLIAVQRIAKRETVQTLETETASGWARVDLEPKR
jgi:hypothetical protein